MSLFYRIWNFEKNFLGTPHEQNFFFKKPISKNISSLRKYECQLWLKCYKKSRREREIFLKKNLIGKFSLLKMPASLKTRKIFASFLKCGWKKKSIFASSDLNVSSVQIPFIFIFEVKKICHKNYEPCLFICFCALNFRYFGNK